MNNVEITSIDVPLPEWSDSCRNFTVNTLDSLGIMNWELSLVFCGKDYITSLNSTYRNINAPTDVLSFSQTEYNDEKNNFLAGDIVICLETMEENAAEYGVTRNEELKRLIIHGILHLKGMDHASNDPHEEMIITQESLLRESGENIF